MNTIILGLSKDKAGLIARTKTMEKGNYFHIHSDEMTPYQQRIHKKLLMRHEIWTKPHQEF